MYLTPNDFEIQNGELVKPNDQGYSFVFFFTDDCTWCNDVKPAFNYLSEMIRGVNFAYMDVAQNNLQLRDMSLRTQTPIEYVPLLLLFRNGRQIAQFFQESQCVGRIVLVVDAVNRHALFGQRLKAWMFRAAGAAPTGPVVHQLDLAIPQIAVFKWLFRPQLGHHHRGGLLALQGRGQLVGVFPLHSDKEQHRQTGKDRRWQDHEGRDLSHVFSLSFQCPAVVSSPSWRASC